MNVSKEQTVFIIDDDASVRDSVVELVESIGLSSESYSSPLVFLDANQTDRPGCIVLDVRMPEMSGLVLQEKLNELKITMPVIILTGHGDVEMAVQAMKAGAQNFLQKPYRDQALLDSIIDALATDVAARRLQADGDNFELCLAALTDREKEVLDHLLVGKVSKEIARELMISPRTVEAHRHNLLRKFKVSSAKELIVMHRSAD